MLKSPQLTRFVSQFEQWKLVREKQNSIRMSKTLVLLPDSRVPMNIIIRSIDSLKKSGSFNEVILAGGLI